MSEEDSVDAVLALFESKWLTSKRAPSRSAVLALGLVYLLLGASAGCGSGPDTSGGGSGGAEPCGPGQVDRVGGGCCEAGELPLEDGRCLPAGVRENGCSAGEVAIDGGPIEGGSCRPAGIPPAMCGEGFEPDQSGGCEAILPAGPCPKGMMAIPGETECHEIAPCGAGKWGDIPVESDTQFVDKSYADQSGQSDGTAQRPWQMIQDAVDAAAAGAIVAVADGTYAEDVDLAGSPVRLWGRCPSKVEVVGTGVALGTVFIKKNASGTEVRQISITGPNTGIAMSGSEQVLFDSIRVHDTGGGAIDVTDYYDVSHATLRGSLVEDARAFGVRARGVQVDVQSSVVRGVQPVQGQTLAPGVLAVVNVGSGRRGQATMARSVVEGSFGFGVWAAGADCNVTGSAVRRIEESAMGAVSVYAIPYDGYPATVSIEASAVEGAPGTAVIADGASIDVQRSVITCGEPSGAPGDGDGVVVLGGGHLDLLTSRVSSCAHSGVWVVGGSLEMEGSIVEDAGSDLAGAVQVTSWEDPTPSSAHILASELRRSRGAGVATADSEVRIEGTAIRGTTGGKAILYGKSELAQASLTVSSGVIEDNDEGGVVVLGGQATVKSTVIRDTASGGMQPIAPGLTLGENEGSPAVVLVQSCVVEGATLAGLVVAGAQIEIDATAIRGTTVGSNGGPGFGIYLGAVDGSSLEPSGEIRGCVIENAVGTGVQIEAGHIELRRTSVRGTAAWADGSFGDGIAAKKGGTSVTATDVYVGHNARVGVASFGASIALAGMTSECNAAGDLDAETFEGAPGGLDDLGDNSCGCEGEMVACQVKTLSLEPPPALDDI